MEGISIYMEDRTIKVVEIFESINGEGMKAGELAVFVRFAGCNLNCSYCDTRWANEPDVKYAAMRVDEIVERVKKSGIRNVTLTGGEPLLQPDIDKLIACLLEESLHVEIETNGSVSLEKAWNPEKANHPEILRKQQGEQWKRPVFTMDYKLPGGHMEDKMNIRNFAVLESRDTVKFVVSDRADLERAKEIIEQFRLCELCHVIISPVFGSIELPDIVEFMKENRMNHVRMQLQLHKYIWDPMERGV